MAVTKVRRKRWRRSDPMTKAQRSYCMSQVKGQDNSLEKLVRSALHKRGHRFRKHVREIPGRPDIVFQQKKIAIFLDGKFWHGYRFKQWEWKLSAFWRKKISENIKRDKRNFATLRRRGWKVVRLWEHHVRRDLELAIDRIELAINI